MLCSQQLRVAAETNVVQPRRNVVCRPIGDRDVRADVAIRLRMLQQLHTLRDVRRQNLVTIQLLALLYIRLMAFFPGQPGLFSIRKV